MPPRKTLDSKQASSRDAKAEQARQDAAAKRGKALGGRDKRFISALEIERQGYVTRGRDDRVKAVDEQLATYRKGMGVDAPAGAKSPAGGQDDKGQDDKGDQSGE